MSVHKYGIIKPYKGIILVHWYTTLEALWDYKIVKKNTFSNEIVRVYKIYLQNTVACYEFLDGVTFVNEWLW